MREGEVHGRESWEAVFRGIVVDMMVVSLWLEFKM